MITPLLSPLFFALLLASQPVVAQTRGPEPPPPSQNDIPEWLRRAVIQQAEHQSDNTAMMIGLALNIAVTVAGVGIFVFKSGKYVEKVEEHERKHLRHDEEFDKVWRNIAHTAERLKDCPVIGVGREH